MKTFFTLFFILFTYITSIYAQTNLDRNALEEKMNQYYREAERFKTTMPQYDPRGIYGGFGFNVISIPEIAKTWHVSKTCDCKGNVIRIDTVENASDYVSRITKNLTFEWQPFKRLSFSWSGYNVKTVLDSGKLVLSSSNTHTSLRETMKVSYWNIQSTVKWYLHQQFYLGSGINWLHIKTQHAQTNALNQYTNNNATETPQYEKVLIDENRMKTLRWAPTYFFGLSTNENALFGLHYKASMEFGVLNKTTYLLTQIQIPLTKKMWQRNRQWTKLNNQYRNIYERGESIERQLYPERFSSSDGGDGGSSSGGDSGGGSSGGCGGGNS